MSTKTNEKRTITQIVWPSVKLFTVDDVVAVQTENVSHALVQLRVNQAVQQNSLFVVGTVQTGLKGRPKKQYSAEKVAV